MDRKLESRVYSMEEVLKWPRPEWLVEGLIHRGSPIFVNGAPKTGKSLFALRLAAAVSTGNDFFGSRTQKGNVLYLAAERAKLMPARAMALEKAGFPVDYSRMQVYPKPIPFLNHAEVEKFARELEMVPDLIIVDTLRRCFEGGSENDNNDMTFWCAGVECFCELTGSAAVVIHHNHRDRKDTYGRTMAGDYAGAGGLLGSLDAQFSLRTQKNGYVTISVDGANEGNDFLATARTEPITIGEHVTYVMLEVDPEDQVDKPDLWPLVKEVIRSHDSLNQTQLTEKCKEVAEIAEWWPALNKSTISNLLKEHRDEVKTSKVGSQKFVSLLSAVPCLRVVA